MNNNLILALDIGTTTCKISIFDIENKKHFNVLKEYKLNIPHMVFIWLQE